MRVVSTPKRMVKELYMSKRPDASEIKAAISPAEFWAIEIDGLERRREHGWADGNLCPLHADRRRGSFKVHLDTGRYKCFSCGESGDLIDFLMKRYGLDFRDALARLASIAGVAV